jgi:hypothetical protein
MMTFSLKLNKGKKYSVICNNNQVEFEVTVNMGSHYQILIKSLKGDFDFYSDSLRIITNPPEQDTYMRFKYNKKEFTGYQVIEKGKTLICYLSINGDYGSPSSDPAQIFTIPPSGFIKYNGKPLLTDTIRISLK